MYVDGDRASLAALVRNLADNAVRYSPAGSAVRVRLAWEEGTAALTVDDTGPGIPAAERERVFDRFYRRARNDESDEGDEGGNGLGLAIVKSVAAQHGAAVALEASPGGGLRVAVRFTLST